MRTEPSAADRELMRRVRDEHEGVTVSATQLERWRGRGLLPPVELVREGFGGTSVAPHGEQVLRTAVLLGRESRSVRPWPRMAERLFNEELPLTQTALQAAAAYLVDDEKAKMTAMWEAAKRDPALSPEPPAEDFLVEDPLDTAGLLGEQVAAQARSLRRELSPRRRLSSSARRATPLLRAVRREIELAHPDRTADDRDLQDYVAIALTWRVVDLVLPEALTDTHRNLARHGVAESMTPVGDGVYPLPSERLVVAKTLTKAEAEQYLPFAEGRIKENPVLRTSDFGLLWVLTWIVAYERVKISGGAIQAPLPQSQLDRAQAMLASSREK